MAELELLERGGTVNNVLADVAAKDGAARLERVPGVRLCCEGVGLRLHSGATLLDGVSCALAPGEAVALMGPSGAGKTSLLRLLAARTPARSGRSGRTTANGIKYTTATFAAFGTVAPQEDVLLENLTARELVDFARQLRGAPAARVDDLLAAFELGDRASVRASFLSGGQRKRLSVAMEMVHAPSVLLVDEPTTGLDSLAAKRVTRLVVDLAKRTGTTLCASIHQPAAECFFAFSKLLLLTAGRVAYFGPTEGAAPFLAPDPTRGGDFAHNPADLAIEAVSGDRARAAADAWDAYDRSEAPPAATSLAAATERGRRPPRGVLAGILFRRAALQIARSQGMFQVKSAAFSAVFFGVPFYRTPNTQSDATLILNALFMCAIINGMVPGLLQVCFVPLERPTMRREYLNGCWRLPEFLVARVAVAGVLQCVSAATSSVIMYFMIGMRGSLWRFILILTLNGLLFQQIGLAIGAVAGAIILALPVLIPVNLVGILYAGFFFTIDDLSQNVSKIGIPLWYLSAYRYTLTLLVTNEFKGGRFAFCDPLEDFCPFASYSGARRVKRDVLLKNFLKIPVADVDNWYLYIQAGYIVVALVGCFFTIKHYALRP